MRFLYGNNGKAWVSVNRTTDMTVISYYSIGIRISDGQEMGISNLKNEQLKERSVLLQII